MRKAFAALAAISLMMGVAVAPAAGDSGAGELMSSFQAGLSGGVAIDFHSDVADGVASPQTNPEGRLEPFGALEEVCDQLVVGTWVVVFLPDRDELEAVTNEFKLDGEQLATVRTPLKRISQGPDKGQWWFAEGVPVLGTLDEGLHDVEWSLDDGFGFTLTLNTPVDVDPGHC